jgi:hypothetical protein
MGRFSTTSMSAAVDGVAITPHATNTFAETRGVTSVAGGTATVRFADSTADVQVQLNAGFLYPYCIVACRVSGTTATGIVGLY